MHALVGPIAVLIVSPSAAWAERLSGALDDAIFQTAARFELPDEGPVGCDLLVLDIRADPFGRWRRLRDERATSIVLLGGDSERVHEMIEAGADDVVLRWERTQEVAARVRAIARRRNLGARSEDLPAAEIQLDRRRHEVTVRGQRQHLPLKQFQLLELLLANPGRVMTRSRIRNHLWGMWPPDHSNTLDVQVRRLRQAIEADPRRPMLITTVRGVGYRYDPRPAPR